MDVAIVQCLRNIDVDLDDCALDDDISVLSTSKLIDCIVRMMWTIEPGLRDSIKSSILPDNVLRRIQMAQSITSALERLKYRRSLGYQQLLYGSVDDVRHVLLYLCETIGRRDGESAADVGVVDDRSSWRGVVASASRAMRREMEEEPTWTPIYCRRMRMKWRRQRWYEGEEGSDVGHVQWRPRGRADIETAEDSRDLPASLLKGDGAGDDKIVIDASQHANASAVAAERKNVKPALPPKPKGLARGEKEGLKIEEETRERLLQLQRECTAEEHETRERRRRADEILQNTRALLASNAARQSAWKTDGSRLLSLLRNPDTTVHKLTAVESNVDGRIAKLETQWTSHRDDKLAVLLDIQAQIERRAAGRTHKQRQELGDVRRRIGEFDEDIDEKRAYVEHLKKQSSKVKKSASRSAYTRRILDMVASVRKQRAAIDRVVADNVHVQRQTRTTAGRLERTEVACRMQITQHGADDTLTDNAVDALHDVHETCAAQLTAIEHCALASKQCEHLKSLIEVERLKAVDDNLQRLVNDYCQVKQENDRMEMEVGK